LRGEERHNRADIIRLTDPLERLHAENERLALVGLDEVPALTRMPCGPSAAAKYFTSVSIVPFVAA
jgi:hypothetical protein